MDDDAELSRLGEAVGAELLARGQVLATAESCTGGWIGQVVTAVSGSSAWYDRGFITYSNAAKTDLLGVPPATLDACGAVSEETACAMAAGALARSVADISVAVTGIAGPTGGTPQKPVGTVWIAWATPKKGVAAALFQFCGDRLAVRRQTVEAALRGVMDRLDRGDGHA